MLASRSVVSVLLRSCKKFLYILKAGPAARQPHAGHRGAGLTLPHPGTGSIDVLNESLSPGRMKEAIMTTATDQDSLDMPVSDVRRIIQSGRACHVVLLQEPESGRRLPIFIGHETAIEIALRLLGHGPQLGRPLGSDLTAHLVQALGGTVREVRIDRLTEGTYYAIIIVDGPQGTAEVDARPSDALALALVVGAPVRADRTVVETTETDETVAEALAAIDSKEAVRAQALLDEISQANERQNPPEPASS
jgi:bifunctional DNase/RNase